MPSNLVPTVVAIAPTTTPVVELTVSADEAVTVQIENLSATETFTGTVRRSLDVNNAMADTTMPDFASIPPLGSVVADLVFAFTQKVDVVGTMTGAGGNVRVTAVSRLSRARRLL
jgi:hypothetical protein